MNIVKSVIDHFEPLSDKDKLYCDSRETTKNTFILEGTLTHIKNSERSGGSLFG